MMLETRAKTKRDADNEATTIFKIFDTDGDGRITRLELKQGLAKVGESPSEQELDAMFAGTDLGRTGFIDFAEFKKMMGYD